ncbi:chorismate lyase [Reinekea thalattae]|uniref:Probable chorismate pyruvate-lyase n=2 Tax=Reinekea thalattae TaxID=2593301 RepID=A0A5C8Z038_9GAMM|nr:chorismate lyase [Reinekea thalattae]
MMPLSKDPNNWLDHYQDSLWGSCTAIKKDSSLSAMTLQWLCNTESLTLRLKDRCQQFSVNIIHERLAEIDPHEQLSLDVAQIYPNYWVREVYLLGDGQPWVFARSVMPLIDNSPLSELQKLNNRPLGELLFANPRLKIADRSAAKLPVSALINPTGSTSADELWGRRTKYCLDDYPVVVTEVFLHDAPAY